MLKRRYCYLSHFENEEQVHDGNKLAQHHAEWSRAGDQIADYTANVLAIYSEHILGEMENIKIQNIKWLSKDHLKLYSEEKKEFGIWKPIYLPCKFGDLNHTPIFRDMLELVHNDSESAG